MYVLYTYPISQHARRVVALLEEAGIEYQNRPIDLAIGEYMSPEYLAINPNHQVPTLVDGEVKIHESNAILRYICTQHELADWYPGDLKQFALVEQWLDWNQCQLGPSVVDIVLNKVFLGEQGDKAAIARGEAGLPELLHILDAGLEGRNFLAGENPTIADLSVGSNITHLEFADMAPVQARVSEWIKRVCSIEGFKKTLPQS